MVVASANFLNWKGEEARKGVGRSDEYQWEIEKRDHPANAKVHFSGIGVGGEVGCFVHSASQGGSLPSISAWKNNSKSSSCHDEGLLSPSLSSPYYNSTGCTGSKFSPPFHVLSFRARVTYRTRSSLLLLLRGPPDRASQVEKGPEQRKTPATKCRKELNSATNFFRPFCPP